MNTNEELKKAFLKNAPSIKEYSIDIDYDEYQKLDDKSYIYEWINLKNLKIYEDTGNELKIYYTGYNSERQCLPHEASNIQYFHSSNTNKDFLDDLSDPSAEWKLRIISIGKADVMQCEEWLILTTADNGIGAKKSKLYYNNHNGGIMQKTTKLDKVKCDAIVKQITEGHFPINVVDKETHRKMYDFQPRDVTDPKWIADIRDRVNAAGGNISLTDPTIVFEGLGKNGEGKAVCGIHTKFGVLDSKATKIKELILPYEIVKDLTASEIRYICNQFNKRPQVGKKYINSDTCVKEIVDGYIEDGIEDDDPIWPAVIKSHGFVRTDAILKIAKAEIDEIKAGKKDAKAGKVRKRYDLTERQGGCKEELTKALDKVNIPNAEGKPTSTTLAVGFATGNAKAVPISIIDIINDRKEKHKLSTNRVEVSMYHTKAIHHEKWDKPGKEMFRNDFERRMHYIFSAQGIDFEIKYPEEFDYHTLGEKKNKIKLKEVEKTIKEVIDFCEELGEDYVKKSPTMQKQLKEVGRIIKHIETPITKDLTNPPNMV